jgi:hypothetical protein
MADEYVVRYGNGVQKKFEVPRSINKVVYVGGVLTTPASSDSQSITLTNAPALGVPIEIEYDSEPVYKRISAQVAVDSTGEIVGLYKPDGTISSAGGGGGSGLSAYQIAVSNGFVGTQASWLASLVGPQGPQGVPGSGGGGSGGGSADIAFSTSVPLTSGGVAYMPIQAVSGPLAFTPGNSPVKNSSAYVVLVANGANTPTFTGFKEWGGSLGWDNRVNIANQVQFFYDGYANWYSISQAVGAVAEPIPATAVTLSGPSSGVVSTASSAFTLAANGALSGTVVVTPSDSGAGGTFSPTTVSLSAGVTSGTFTYTPASTGTKTVSVTNNGGLSNPAGVTYTVTAAATVPAAPTIGTITAGDGYIDVPFTAGGNGGSAILDYTVTTLGGATATGTSSPIRVTVPNGVAVTATVKARNSVGLSAASAQSNSVTPVAAAVAYPQLSQLSNMSQSGTGPYSYAGTGGDYNTAFGLSTTGLQAGQDGSLAGTVAGSTTVGSSGTLIGATTATAPSAFTNLPYAFYTSNPYSALSAGSAKTVTNSVACAIGDIMRMRRSGTTMIAEVSKNSGSTWTEVASWTGVTTAAMKFQVETPASGAVTSLTGVGLA